MGHQLRPAPSALPAACLPACRGVAWLRFLPLCRPLSPASPPPSCNSGRGIDLAADPPPPLLAPRRKLIGELQSQAQKKGRNLGGRESQPASRPPSPVPRGWRYARKGGGRGWRTRPPFAPQGRTFGQLHSNWGDGAPTCLQNCVGAGEEQGGRSEGERVSEWGEGTDLKLHLPPPPPPRHRVPHGRGFPALSIPFDPS